MTATALQAVRKLQGYSANEVIRLLLRRAETLNIPVMSATSLKTKISRWENGHERVSEPYRRLFRDIYGRTNEELGFPPEPEDEETGELLARLTVVRTLDGATVEIFRQQINNARHIDRRYGAITVLDQLRATIKQVESLLGYSTTRGHRELLAGILTEASAPSPAGKPSTATPYAKPGTTTNAPKPPHWRQARPPSTPTHPHNRRSS